LISDNTIGILLVLCSTTIESFGQIFLKYSAKTKGGEAGKRRKAAVGIACLCLEAIVWTFALTKLNVSIAYPMGSLSFVMVVLMSRLILNEKVQKERWLGVALILCGTALLSLNS
jgi:undecaprenyl phosphate-alpha-L-ara4N flippase subunit ArnE